MAYYLTIDGRTVGPMNADELLSYSVNSNTPVSKDGGEWQPLYMYPELMHRLNNRSVQNNRGAVSDSQRVLCGILAIIVGSLGIQYFVIGKTAAGIYTILLSIVTCGVWSIITFIQGILMLCMSDAEFEQKYVETPKSFPIF